MLQRKTINTDQRLESRVNHGVVVEPSLSRTVRILSPSSSSPTAIHKAHHSFLSGIKKEKKKKGKIVERTGCGKKRWNTTIIITNALHGFRLINIERACDCADDGIAVNSFTDKTWRLQRKRKSIGKRGPFSDTKGGERKVQRSFRSLVDLGFKNRWAVAADFFLWQRMENNVRV